MGSKIKRISIVGTVGVPASYGGFETLAENLVRFACLNSFPVKLFIYCSGAKKADSYMGAELRYVPLGANGVSSVFYDVVSLLLSVLRKSEVILLLGVSGAIAIPVIRLVSRAKIVTNIDGIEWKRNKWNGIARWFLRVSESIAVKFSHVVIADNQGISDYVKQRYGMQCNVIAYGGDHAVAIEEAVHDQKLPKRYALALCRIEPENNVEMILESFRLAGDIDLVFIGNWHGSKFGQSMKLRYEGVSNIHILDPIYDLRILKVMRSRASCYVHGHSAGGTNPSLVEMMHFGLPILAFDCSFNRYTTNEKAAFFTEEVELVNLLRKVGGKDMVQGGAAMKQLAFERYTWDVIGDEYFRLLLS